MREPLYAQQPSSLIWRRRVIALGTFAVTILAAVIVTAITLDGGPATASLSLASLRLHPLRVAEAGHLAQAVQQAAGSPAGGPAGAMLVVGGLDASGSPVVSIQRLGPATKIVGHLASALPGAGAAELGGAVYAFGGGTTPPSNAILALPSLAGGSVRQPARLPRAVTGAAVVAVGQTAFVIGGSDGSADVDAILAWAPGGAAHRTAHLPAGLTHAAAASVGGRVIIAGGSARGVASRNILRFDPAKHQVTQIGALPAALTDAGAAALGGLVFVIGGRGSKTASQTRAIYAIDPESGRVAFAGTLPSGLSDAAVATVGNGVVVAGGLNRAGIAQGTVLELRLPVGF